MEAPELLAFFKKFGASIICVLLVGVSYPLPAADYEISAHAALTRAIFDFHNKSFPDRTIPLEYRYDLVAGAMDEDSGTRSLYHFYDPISSKGLKFGNKRFMPATDWVREKSAPQNDYTWDAALRAYAAGDDKAAFIALGHVLHLLEDLGTPEHARNDPHPLNSPYEEFTRNLVPTNLTKPPIVLGSVRDYFVSLAKYSNEHFYSADTINSGYAKPKSTGLKRDGVYEYALGVVDGEKYYLARALVDRNNLTKKDLSINEEFGNKKVLSDYWRLLSAKTVQHGAGLVRLFFAEGDKLRGAESAKAKTRQKVVARGTLASIADAFAPFFGGEESGDGLTEDDEVDATDGVSYPPAQSARAAKKKTPGAGDEAEKPGSSSPTSVAVPKPAPIPACAYAVPGAPAKTPVVVNEVAWMGSKASATDEWIELKNIGPNPVDLSGWQLINRKGRIEVRFPAGSSIPAGGFYLLERTGDDAVPNIKANLIYEGALSNADDGVHLYSSGCALIDAVEASPAWPAGNAAERRTMELGVTGAWHSYSGAVSGGISGTPKRENGPPPVIVVAPPRQTGVGGSGGIGTAPPSGAGATASGSSGTSSVSPSGTGSVRINEILFDAEGSDAGKEFIELHNPGTAAVDLAGWSIQTQTAKKNFEDGNAIPAGGCFLVTMGSGAPSPALGMRWTSGSLNNTSGTAYAVRNQDFVSGDSDADIADRAAYANSLPGFAPGASAERDDAGTFHVRAVPNPGDCSRAGSSGASTGTPSGSSSGASSGGFLKGAYFYQDPAGDGSLIDLHFDRYPFVPGKTDAAKVLVFYKNSAPLAEHQVNTASDWSVSDPHVISVQYPTYCGGCMPVRPSLVLPDVADMSQSGQGVAPVAYRYSALHEDKMVRLKTGAASAGDYITIAYYDLSYSAGGNQSFALVSADPTKYYFNDPKPAHAAPVLSGGISPRFDPARNTLTITLPLATDADSVDALLSYSFSLNGRLLGLGYSAGGDYSFVVAAGDTFDISYSAADEFNLRSVPAGDEWSFPGAVTWALVQERGDSDTVTLGQADQNCPSCERTASYQSISFPSDTPINVVSVRLKSDRGRADATLRMRLYADLGSPALAEKSLALGDLPISQNQDISFVFDSPVTLRADTPYRLMLDVADYANGNDQYAPYLYQRLAGGDPYPGGTAGWRTTARFLPDLPVGSDWQMKVGIWER